MGAVLEHLLRPPNQISGEIVPISTQHTNIVPILDEAGPALAFANSLAPFMQDPANDALAPHPALGQRVGGLAPGPLRRVREHVESHLAEKIGLTELAAIAKLSDCHFSRVFKQSVGVSPHRYIMTRRIAAAARLMQDCDRPLIEISHAVGFSDQSHFTRVFVDVMGETPGVYQWRHR